MVTIVFCCCCCLQSALVVMMTITTTMMIILLSVNDRIRSALYSLNSVFLTEFCVVHPLISRRRTERTETDPAASILVCCS